MAGGGLWKGPDDGRNHTKGRVSSTDTLQHWDLPGGPVVKTSTSRAGVVGLILGQGTRISHASGQKYQNTKQKQYCNKFSEDLKSGPCHLTQQLGPGNSTAHVPWNPCSATSEAHRPQQSAREPPQRLREARNRKKISATLTTKDVESQLASQLSKEWRQSWAGGRPDFHGNENSKFCKRRDEERTQSCRTEAVRGSSEARLHLSGMEPGQGRGPG